MHTFISLNCRILDRALARIDATSAAALYGKGIFTTIAVYDRRLHLWEKHWARLVRDASRLGMHLGKITEAAVYDAANELVANNEVVNGRVRITLFDESPTKLWGADERAGTTLLVVTGEFRTRPDTLRLGISPYLINSTSPTAGIKSCNYLENLMAADDAKGRGFDEAIRLNERGVVTSACMANVFWLANDRLFTPSLTTGCLAGTTREFVMEDLDCEEVETGLEELRYADAIFLTSAGLGVVRVAELDGKGLEGEGHSILGLIPGT